MSSTTGQKPLIIAIDGPAGSGKSTAARLFSEIEKLTHLNTGAMYRAVTYLALEGGIDPETEPNEVVKIAQGMVFEYRLVNGAQHFFVSPRPNAPLQDVSREIFTAALTQKLKPVVNNENVRAALVQKMRTATLQVLEQGAKGVVLEGRDIGTVVFPDAYLKFFLHADLGERARRRAAELRSKGEVISEEGLKQQIAYRDQIDSTRAVGPLKKADDAIDLDTTHLPIDGVLKRLQEELKKREAQ
jgi:cytidylate kinase